MCLIQMIILLQNDTIQEKEGNTQENCDLSRPDPLMIVEILATYFHKLLQSGGITEV